MIRGVWRGRVSLGGKNSTFPDFGDMYRLLRTNGTAPISPTPEAILVTARKIETWNRDGRVVNKRG